MKNTTIKSWIHGCKWLFGLAFAVFFLCNFQKLHAQCTAPIATASPSSQTICDCSTTSIALSSNIQGTTFSWTAIQTGVSGASAGTGSSIAQTLCTTGSVAGTAIYTITPTANGCVGNTINDTVTIDIDAASFSYPSATFCQTGTDPTPTITGMQGGAFLSSPVGLMIDSSTGLVSLATSALGTYTVTYTTTGTCPNTSSITMTVTGALSANFSYLHTSYCQSASNPSPIFGSGASAGTFSASPAGLVFVHVNTGEIDLATSALGTYTVSNTIIANGGCVAVSSSTIVTINLMDDASFVYTSGSYCPTGTNPTPAITGIPGGVFSATPVGLSINPSTGTINLATSTLGTFTVTYSTNGTCTNSSSVNIIITTTPSANFGYSSSPYCLSANNPLPTFGSGASPGTFSATPMGLVFVNVSTGQVNTAASAPGTYTVINTIAANGGCTSASATAMIQINNCGIITGSVYKDNNANCIMDSVDQGVVGIPLKFYDNNNNFLGTRYSTWWGGAYQFAAPLGTYNVKTDTTNLPFTIQCINPGVDSIVTLTTGTPIAANVNFEIACKPGFDVGVVGVFPYGTVFPGVQHKLQIGAGDMIPMNWYWYNFNCSQGVSGQVQVTVTGPVTYNGPAPSGFTPTVSGNTFTYTIANFGTINNWQSFGLKLTTTTSAQAGDQICVNVIVTPTAGDNNVSNNNYDFCYLVGNSFDPNMKEVYPVNVAPAYQDWFTYTIHFQNTGNAAAMNIRLTDTLDANIDFETFQLINYSDSIEVSLDNNLLNFRFQNIMLPDSTSDPEGSKGFVQYRVKPKANLPVGTQIKNTAYIYFDYNAPIVTNTTINEFVLPLSINENKSAVALSVYPNPGSGKYEVKSPEGMKNSEISIKVYNLFGELILTTKMQNSSSQIDLSNQPIGIYIIKVNDLNQSFNQRLIKQK